MRIAGFQPLTLSDFSGHTAAIVFTAGCNFRCPFCHNGDLVTNIGGGSFARVLDRIETRCKLLDGVVITGGEPTLQDDLAPCLQQIKALGLKTKLDTNGSRPDVLRDLLDQSLIDFVAMDIKAPWDRYEELVGGSVDVGALQESVDLIVNSSVSHLFRTTHVPSLLNEQDLVQVRAQLPVEASYCVQPFIAEHALDPSLRRAG